MTLCVPPTFSADCNSDAVISITAIVACAFAGSSNADLGTDMPSSEKAKLRFVSSIIASRRNAPAGISAAVNTIKAGLPSSITEATITSALSAQSTKCLVPDNNTRSPSTRATAVILCRSQSPCPSYSASVATDPAAILGNQCACCSSVPPALKACIATVVDTNGEANRLRPICSTTGTTSASDSPTPLCASGTAIASQPRSAISRHTSAS